jgi:LuxR family maltose regulon positive regulatory protein
MNTATFQIERTSPPILSDRLLVRDVLMNQVIKSNHALITIHTAAGFGKSTLMAQCYAKLQETGVSALWLTCDKSDNDVNYFVRSLSLALTPVLPQSPAASDSPLDLVGQTEKPWILFLDECEHLKELDSINLLNELIRRIPRNARVVMATRNTPFVSTQELDKHGLDPVSIIDEGSLRFSLGDIRELINILDAKPLNEQQLKELYTRTEGWPLALGLITQAFVDSNTGDTNRISDTNAETHIGEYLAEEVFLAQRPEIREFLLRTSVLHTLEVDLCQMLNPEMDAAKAIKELADSHTFLVQVDSKSKQWRFQRLFADFLRNRLRHDLPTLFKRLHLMASGWYETHHRLAPAIEHAISGGDKPLASEILERGCESFLSQDRFRMLLNWFELIESENIVHKPLLQVTHAWCICLIHGPIETRNWINQYKLNQCTDPRIKIYLSALNVMILAKEDRYAEALKIAEAVNSELSVNTPFISGVLTNLIAHISFVLGRPLIASRLLEIRSPLSAFDRIYREATLGLMNLLHGQPKYARSRMEKAIGEASQGRGPYVSNPWISVPYASTLYEAGELPKADLLLAEHLAAARDASMPDHMICAYVLRSRVAHLNSDMIESLRLLCDLEHDGLERNLQRVASCANLERARLMIMIKQFDSADMALSRAEELFDWQSVDSLAIKTSETFDPIIGKIRILLAKGNTSEAMRLIDEQIKLSESHNRRRLKLDLLKVIASWNTGSEIDACKDMHALLNTFNDIGYFSIVTDEGWLVTPILRRLLLDVSKGPRGSRDPMLQVYIERMLGILGLAPLEIGLNQQVESMLTNKELEILRALTEGKSNQAISEQFQISDSTVRTHLRNINSKLAATSRSQAVANARRLMLVG